MSDFLRAQGVVAIADIDTRKLTRILAKFVFGFVVLSLALVVLFKWLPVPVTATRPKK